MEVQLSHFVAISSWTSMIVEIWLVLMGVIPDNTLAKYAFTFFVITWVIGSWTSAASKR